MQKGITTLDDIALGITYNKEPYTTTERFSVITPDIESQHKFFTVKNYTHHFMTKLPEGEDNPGNKAEAKKAWTQINPLAKPIEEAPVQAEAVPVCEEGHGQNKEVTAEQKEIKTPSKHGKSMTMKSPMKTSIKPTKTFIKLPKKCSVYEPKELYVANNTSLDTKFGKTNPYKGTKYYNMESVLGLNKNNTLGDVLRSSQQAESLTMKELKSQHDKRFLASHNLPTVPEKRADPKMIVTPIDKNVAKKIGNEAHMRMTNGGYSRTIYGGYFMQ